jgi:hypothetical protein
VPALLFGFFVAVYALTSAGRLDAVDGIVAANTARALVEHHTLAMPATHYPGVVIGVGGYGYSKYGIGLSIVEIPFVMLGLVLRNWTHDAQTVALTISFTNTFVTATSCAVFYLLVRHLGASLRRGVALTLLFGLCTLAWVYAKTDFSAPLETLTLLVAVYSALRASESRRIGWLVVSGAALGCAVLTRPALLVAAPALSLYVGTAGLLDTDKRWRFASLRTAQWWRTAVKQQLALWAPVALAIGVTLWLDLVRFGSVFDLGYGRTPGDSDFGGSIVTGLFGLLLSGNSGLIFYSTSVLLGLIGLRRFARLAPREALLIGVLVLCMLGLYGTYRYWAGLAAYGPRYIVPLIPFLLLPAVDAFPGAWDRPREHPWAIAIMGALALAGFAEAALGVTVSFGAYSTLTCLTLSRPCPNSLDASQSELLYDIWLLRASLAYNLLSQAPHIVLSTYPFGAPPVGRLGWQHGLLDRMQYFWFEFVPNRLWSLALGIVICGGLATACLTTVMRRARFGGVRTQYAIASVEEEPTDHTRVTRMVDAPMD